MGLAIVILAIVSLFCFVFWARPNGATAVDFWNDFAFVPGTIHLALSLPFYILFTIANGFSFNWLSALCVVVIVTNLYYNYWFYSKFKEKYDGKIFTMIEKMPHETNWGIVTIVPNALLILFLGIIQLDKFGV